MNFTIKKIATNKLTNKKFRLQSVQLTKLKRNKMTYNYDINKEVQNLLVNYPNRVIRVSTDYQIVTIGRLQIENLNWKWEPEWSDQIGVYLKWDPWDWMSAKPFNQYRGNFKVTKYGLSYRKNPLTVTSYTPLWEPGTKPETQVEIMAKEMCRMQKEGARKCENGIEIIPESPLWNTVDTLTTKARNTFRTTLGQKVQDLESRGIKYDGERLLNDGVRVTPDIIKIVRNLSAQLTK